MRLKKGQAKAMGLEVTPKKGKPLPKDVKRVALLDAVDRKAKAKKGADGKGLFLAACEAHGLPKPVDEHPFHPTRKWRFDWLFDGWLALEVNGGNFAGGRHVKPADLLSEYEKINEAQIMGYVVLIVTPEQVNDGSAFALVRRALESQ